MLTDWSTLGIIFNVEEMKFMLVFVLEERKEKTPLAAFRGQGSLDDSHYIWYSHDFFLFNIPNS